MYFKKKAHVVISSKMVSLLPFNKLENFRTKRIENLPIFFSFSKDICVYYQRNLQEFSRNQAFRDFNIN